VSILPAPALASEVRAGSLVARRPAGQRLERPIGVIHRRGRELSRATRALLDRLTDQLGAAA
jgi:DNA-binding transcriptional LysR family regulator